jgi:SAM-dependent methyltransferase
MAGPLTHDAEQDAQAIRTAVRERYARAATMESSCCGNAPGVAVNQAGTSAGSCCVTAPLTLTDGRALPVDIASASLGCGAPIDAASLQPGETVVDLGSGAGLDIFLAADRVGPAGRAIGVDMTPQMIAKARANAARLGAANVEFRLGEIEHLPVPDESVDVVISNCVINLLPNKRPAFEEAYRVLRPGGRLVVSDIVSSRPLPEELKRPDRWTACLGGAIPERDYIGAIKAAGFTDVAVLSKRDYEGGLLLSATVRAVKPSRP